MNRFFIIAFVAALGSASSLMAQNPFSADTKQSYTGIKNTLLKAADKMPEADYSFRTTDKVRTYGEIIGHIADVQGDVVRNREGRAEDRRTRARRNRKRT